MMAHDPAVYAIDQMILMMNNAAQLAVWNDYLSVRGACNAYIGTDNTLESTANMFLVGAGGILLYRSHGF